MKGIIFDFNGTMVFDTHLHEKAWVAMVNRHNKQASEQEITDFIHGRTNDQTITHFIGEVTKEEIQELSDEKERDYQRLVREERIDYVDGVANLLDELTKRTIPFNIATASPKTNIDFYFDYFKLDRWFKYDEIIYDDGSFPGKPEPTIYEMAAQSLDLMPEGCIVVEDAVAGIQSANRANIGKVIAMIKSEEEKIQLQQQKLEIDAFIWNFDHFLENHF